MFCFQFLLGFGMSGIYTFRGMVTILFYCNSQRDSVCLSVCPSVTFRYCIQSNEDTIVWFSASGRTVLLVSE